MALRFLLVLTLSAQNMPQYPPEKFLDFVTNFRSTNKNQKEALLEFAKAVASLNPNLFADEATWVKKYRTGETSNSKVLKVPYFSQRDNYTDASRTCFSSSCAMLLEFLKPGTLPGPKGDDAYLKRVFSIGDSIYPAVQTQALASFGLKTKFVTNATFSQLDSQLWQNKPVPIGILHKGPANAPSGDGHWIIVIGKKEDSSAPGGAWYVVHDPWGEITHSSGTYQSVNGESKLYSKSLLKSRWTVEGDGSGYAIIA